MHQGPLTPYGGRVDALRHPMKFLRLNAVAADVLLAALLVGVAIAISATTETWPGERGMGALGWTLAISTNGLVAFRRIAPVPTAYAILATTLPYWVLDYSADDAIGPSLMIAAYSLGAHVDRPRSLHHGVTVIGAAVAVAIAGVISPEEDLPWFIVVSSAIVFATAWILGDNQRTRRAYLHELEEKAARLESQRESDSRRAVAEERSRIARELHDVVAHSMSVMVVQAGAARRVIDSEPQQAVEALGTIEETGRESLTEMRRILGVLRSDDDVAELVPAPSLHDFGRLLQHCEEAGLPVDLQIEGEARQLPASLELSAYRIVQESLTNSLKHAGPAEATVRLNYDPDALEVEVIDNGRGAAADTAPAGSGQGIVGMRERVEAFGGTLRIGPRLGGGYRVSARFPVGSDA